MTDEDTTNNNHDDENIHNGDDDDEDNNTIPLLESLSKFDVLTIRNPAKENRLELIDSSLLNHVGNNRIRVFVKMNLTEFSNSPNEDQVVDNLIDIIQTQCQDANSHRCGTFLELQSPICGTNDEDNQYLLKDVHHWKVCSRKEAHDLVKRCLEEEVKEMLAIPTSPIRSVVDDDEKKKRRRRSSLLRRSLSSGNMLEDQKKRIDMRKSVLISTLQQYDIDEEHDEEEEDEEDLLLNTPVANKDKISGFPNDDTTSSSQSENKTTTMKSLATKSQAYRRSTMGSGCATDSNHSRSSASASRRSSMAAAAGARRYSIISGGGSSSHMGGSGIRPVLHRSGSWTAPQRSPESVLCTANPLDVIFDTDYQFIANHTGNNRFNVMIQVSMPRYETLVATADKSNNNNKAQIKQLCRELIKTVQEHYNGRFMIEAVNEGDGSDDVAQGYWCLSEEKTVAAVEALFRNEHAAKQHVKQPPPHVKEQIIEQLSNIPTTLNAIGSMTNLGSSSDMSVASGDVSHTSGSISASATADIHKSAVESLQKRKKRQGLTSKISNLVARSTGFRPRLPSRMKKTDRSQSDSALQVSSADPPNMMQPLPTQNMRYASTGMANNLGSLPENQFLYFQHSERMLNYNPTMPEISEAASSAFNSFEFQQQQEQLLLPQQQQQLQQQHLQQQAQPSRRMTELSDFSQGMIEELLLRLDVDNSYNSYYNNNG